MLFRLAAHLGRFVSEIEHGMDYTEFMEWCEFYSIEPFGEIRDDLRAGVVASAVVNVQLQKKDRSKAKSAGDFILFDALKSKEKADSADAQVMAAFTGRTGKK